MDVRDDRTWLWLHGEKAFGAEAVPVALGQMPQTPVAQRRQPVAAARPYTLPPSRQAVAQARPQAAQPMEPMEQSQLMLSPQDQFTSPILGRQERIASLKAMDEGEVSVCDKCRLCQTRTHTVFGEGDAEAKIFFIGEGPGETEDRTGRPFVGRAGNLLDKMIVAMGLKRENVFIANIVKCRPPENRAPAVDEVAACWPYLVRQLELVRPRVIVTLGLPAVTAMLQSRNTMSRLRGNWQIWRGIKLMPTYHPSYVLRVYTPEVRAAVWSDLRQAMVELGLKDRDAAP